MRNDDRPWHCPNCTGPIHRSDLLIRYRTSEGVRVFASCPACEEPVHPRT